TSRRGLTQLLTDSGSSTGSVGLGREVLTCTHRTWRCDLIGAWPEAPSLSCPRCPAVRAALPPATTTGRRCPPLHLRTRRSARSPVESTPIKTLTPRL